MEENDYIKLQEYLAGTLPEAEQEAFAERINNEPALQEEVAWEQETNDFLRRKLGADKLKNTFAAAENDYFKEDNKEAQVVPMWRKRLLPFIGLAAAVALLLFIFNPFATPDLYQEYSKPSPISLLDKSDVKANAQQAEAAFNAGDYQKAYAYLSAYLVENPDDTRAILPKGIAATEIENYKEAEQILQGISEGTTMLKEEGTWYLALMYLKKGEKEKAKLALEKISESSSRTKSAKQLLQKMN